MSEQGEPVTQKEPPNLELPVNLNNFPPRVDDQPAADDPRRREALDEPWKPGEKRRYGIQFREPLTDKQFKDLKQHFRFSPDIYIPESVYVQLLDQETLERLKNHPLVNAAFRLEGKYKISKGIGKHDVKTDERKRILPDRLLWVVLFPEAEPDEMAKELEKLGAMETRVVDDRNWGGVARIELRLSSLDRLPAIAAIESVRWIEEVPEVSSSAGVPNGVLESGQPDFTPISDAGLHANNEIIGVLDDGVLDVNHCWFDDNGKPPGPGHRKVFNQRSQNGLSPISRHAAFVVGILCGHNITSPGTVPDKGIAWEAKVTYSDYYDITTGKATLAEYLRLATHDGACIHHNSWSVEQRDDEYHLIEEDIDRFAWRHEDCLVVAASGNADEREWPTGDGQERAQRFGGVRPLEPGGKLLRGWHQRVLRLTVGASPTSSPLAAPSNLPSRKADAASISMRTWPRSTSPAPRVRRRSSSAATPASLHRWHPRRRRSCVSTTCKAGIRLASRSPPV